MFHQSSTQSIPQQIQNCRQDLNRISMIANQMLQSEEQNQNMLQQLQQIEANTSQQLARIQQAERNAVQQLQQVQQICNEAVSHLDFLSNVTQTHFQVGQNQTYQTNQYQSNPGQNYGNYQ